LEGFFEVRSGIEAAIARGLAYAPYVDCCGAKTSKPNLEEAREFADGIHAVYPGKMLAYNCSPSFNWRKHSAMKRLRVSNWSWARWATSFSSLRWRGFHALNHTMFELAREYKTLGMSAYSELQEAEIPEREGHQYSAVKHQRFVGTGYFDTVQNVISSGTASTTALAGSTEAEQFHNMPLPPVSEPQHSRPATTDCPALRNYSG